LNDSFGEGVLLRSRIFPALDAWQGRSSLHQHLAEKSAVQTSIKISRMTAYAECGRYLKAP